MSEELLQKISELEEKIHSLEKELVHDKLTQVKTRDYFEKESKTHLDNLAEIHKGKRREWVGFKDISFLFFDIDYFKKVNDTYGHAVGDEVLKEVAQTLRSSLRSEDIVARWGGEEFVAVLLGAKEKESKIKAEEIRKKVEAMNFADPKDLKVSVSIGVAGFEEGISFEDLVKRADKALYKAKETGRNKVVAYSEVEG